MPNGKVYIVYKAKLLVDYNSGGVYREDWWTVKIGEVAERAILPSYLLDKFVNVRILIVARTFKSTQNVDENPKSFEKVRRRRKMNTLVKYLLSN